MTDHDLWKRASELFDRALEIPPGDRARFLDEACAGESGVRDEVESLLRAHEKRGVLDSGPSPPAPLPRAIGPFVPLQEIGRGGMGVVYKAHDPRLDRDVAVKLLPPLLRDDETARIRLLREARAASSLDHANICTIFDVGETEDAQIFIAMAYYPGRTLAEIIAEGPLPVATAVEIARQIAAGLQHAHEAGIVHRDVKPSNVVVTEKGTVKILDFGIAKRKGSQATQPGFRMGTLCYMSPEQIDGREPGPETDVWSLGVVLYEMLAGERPFEGENAAVLVRRIEGSEPRPLRELRPEVPPALEELCRRALRKPPSDRYRSAREVLEALGEIGSDPRPRLSLRIPTELTSFVGRARELEKLSALLRRARLVTLTGPAGTGKSRLAIHICRREAEELPHGSHFVSLASIEDPGFVGTAIAKSLDLAEIAEPPLERILRVLRDRQLLLVLDNFEQVAEAAPLVSSLLAGCPRLTVLVTSRVALRVSGEHEFPVPPLTFPVPGAPVEGALRECSSVELFLDRAQAVDPNFEITEANAAAVGEICRRLDGLPLAIELAAARVKLFSPHALLARLEDRLDELKGGPRDRPSRHQTLRRAISWSYDLLRGPEKVLFRRLGIFVGGFGLDAVERIVGSPTPLGMDAGEGIEALIEHNLVQISDSTRARFHMLGTIRSFALERLEEEKELPELRRVYFRHFLELAERAAPELTGPEQTFWLDRLEADLGNFRSLLGRIEVDAGGSLRLGAALWRFWLARGYLREGHERLEALLRLCRAEEEPRLRARLLIGAGTIDHNLGHNGRARELLEESLALWRELGDESGTATALNSLAWVAVELSDFDTAVRLSEEALSLNRKLGDVRGTAVSLNNLGWVASYRGNSRQARFFHHRSLDLRRKIGDRRGVAFALANLAYAEVIAGRLDGAESCLDEALPLIRSVGDPILTAWVLFNRGRLQGDRGDLDGAAGSLGESLPLWNDGGNATGFALSLTELGAVLGALGKCHPAREILGEALAMWKSIGTRWGEALATEVTAQVAARAGRVDEASRLYREARDLYRPLGASLGEARCFEALARLGIRKGRFSAAATLLGTAERTRVELEAPLPIQGREGIRDAVLRVENRLGSAAFQRAWERAASEADLDAILGDGGSEPAV